jgi:hypothetical protein
MRKMAVSFAAVSLIGAVAGTTELGMHGFRFFIFRANGAGASEIGPKEPVNPVLPPAPGTNPQPTQQSPAQHQPTTSNK